MKLRCSRRMISGLLLLWLGLLQFPLPFAVRAARSVDSAKDRSTPYPCMNRPCGCQSAEECWTSCCCTTKAERIAFVLENGLAMPAALQGSEDTPSSRKGCCSAKSTLAACTATGCSKGVGHCDKCQPSKKDSRNRTVLFSSAMKCKGLTSMLVQFGGALVPASATKPVLIVQNEGYLTPTDDLRTGATLPPPAPPPRITG